MAVQKRKRSSKDDSEDDDGGDDSDHGSDNDSNINEPSESDEDEDLDHDDNDSEAADQRDDDEDENEEGEGEDEDEENPDEENQEDGDGEEIEENASDNDEDDNLLRANTLKNASNVIGYADTSLFNNKGVAPHCDDACIEEENMHGRITRFKQGMQNSLVRKFHRELLPESNDEVRALSTIVRNDAGVIVDKNHRSKPVLTSDEKSRIIGLRATHISLGAKTVLTVEERGDIIDEIPMATKEFGLGKLDNMFIIKRPHIDEYWPVKDLIKSREAKIIREVKRRK